jgi:hypothetical protein
MAESHGTMPMPVEALGVNARATFIVRTYSHLLVAILGFVLIEVFFFTSGLARPMAEAMLGVNWLLVLGGFVVVSWLASRAAHTAKSKGAQYAALAGFVVAQAIIFVPLLFIAQYYAEGGVIESAAMVTLVGFGALTGIAFWTRKDFSDPLRHLERAAPLPGRPLRSGGPPAIRLGSPHVLVRPPSIHVPRLTRKGRPPNPGKGDVPLTTESGTPFLGCPQNPA